MPAKEKEEKKDQKTEKKRNEKGQFVKGHTKVGGRKAGTPNKYGNIRDRLKDIIMPYLYSDSTDAKTPSFISDLMRIDDPKDRIDAVYKMMPFVTPKYTSTTISADANRPISEEQALMELDEKYSKKEVSINIKSLTIVDNDNLTAGDYDPDDDPDFNIDELK